MLLPLILLLTIPALVWSEANQTTVRYTPDYGHGHPTAVARRNLQQTPQASNRRSSQSEPSIRRFWPTGSPSLSSISVFGRSRPSSLFRGPRVGPGFIDMHETTHHEIRVPPPPPHGPPRGPPRPGKTEFAITELKDISQIPKMLRMMKDKIQSMPGIKAFLLTKDVPNSSKLKPQLILASPGEFSSKPSQVIWRFLNSKPSKSVGFAKGFLSLKSRPSSPQPTPPPSSSSTPFPGKYSFVEIPSGIDMDGSAGFSQSSFPLNENIVMNSPESTESSSEEIFIEPVDNQMASNGLTSYNGPISTAESNPEVDELPQHTYYYRDTIEPKLNGNGNGYKFGSPNGDYLQATSSIRASAFSDSPFVFNEHVPLHPTHNGWIPRNTKHWTPGAYRSAFYTPDTRLIKFTIHDRVSSAFRPANAISGSGQVVNRLAPALRNSANNYNNNKNSLPGKHDYVDIHHDEEIYNINDEDLLRTTTVLTTSAPKLSSYSSSSSATASVSSTTTIESTVTASSTPSTESSTLIVDETSTPQPVKMTTV